jgi:hypothetical protein
VIRDRGQWPELAVLVTVLAIAALASYIHLREVWIHAGAPVAAIGPLTVDGLFAAAWLRMRRRRSQGDPVGFLAWLALGLALVATMAGNLSAAWIAGHRDPLSLVVAAWPAAAFAVVWELVTGHGRTDSADSATFATAVAGSVAKVAEPVFVPLAAVTAATRSAQVTTIATMPTADGGEGGETWEAKRARLLAEGAGRKRLAKELGVSEYEARRWVAKGGDQVAAS